MAKQQQMVVTPLDSNVWKVTLTVAIPDYGSAGNYTALDAIIPTLNEEITVLGMQQDLCDTLDLQYQHCMEYI